MTKEKGEDPKAAIRKRVSKITQDPGVYRWLDKDGTVLYVGKAKNLRKRMQSYLLEKGQRSPWTEMMIRQIRDFSVTVVRSELEAFILETNLIKELRPKYNILMKDDKNYVYARISVQDPYAKVDVVRRLEDDGALYFGPFLGAYYTNRTLEMLDSIVHFRACKESIDRLNHAAEKKQSLPVLDTPCLDHQIGRCNGLCIGAVKPSEYQDRIHEVARFFRGNYQSAKKLTIEAMQVAAKNQKFERAAKLRDVLKFIEDLEKRQVISDASGQNVDVFGVALSRGKGQVVLLRTRDGKLIEEVSFALQGEAETIQGALSQFLPQYYSETQDLPETILLSEEIEDQAVFEKWLSERKGKKVAIVIPERGKKSDLQKLAEKNAHEKVEQQFAAWEAEAKKVEGAVTELATLLKLKESPRRIEGYDISHLGGSATVGSMVVFVNGKAKREHYRSFNMRSVKEGMIDDYKSLAEVLGRRLKYLTDNIKTATEREKTRGIEIGKARKTEQKLIDEIVKNNPNELEPEGVEYSRFIVARRGKEIVAMVQLYEYAPSVLAVRTLWVHEKERGHRLGRLLVRKLLAGVDKGKVYVLAHPDLEEYYAEVGFRHVIDGPKVLEDVIERWTKEERYKGFPRYMILMTEVSKNKADPSFSERPDLLLIDGGKGQLSAVMPVLKELGLAIPVAGLAKREEEIFLPGEPVSLLVKEGSEARFLLQRIRDEAHRFANSLREKRLTSSLFASKLDEVPGIGDQTKLALLKKFGSADAAIAASDDELSSVLNASQLEAIRKTFS